MAKLLLALIALLPFVTAEHVLHEKRSHLPPGWEKDARADVDARIPLKIGLVQNNLDQLEELIYTVSDPRRATYGQHFSRKEIADIFAPTDEAIMEVKDWLMDSGIDLSRLYISPSRNWINVDISIAEAEDLLQTTYHTYVNPSEGRKHLATQQYSVPAHVQKHIDLITPSIEFDVSNRQMSRSTIWRDTEAAAKQKRTNVPNARTNLVMPTIELEADKSDLSKCWNLTTPACLEALYEFKATSDNLNKNATIGVVQLNPLSSLLYADLKLFMDTYVPGSSNFYPELVFVDDDQPLNNSYGSLNFNFGLHGEANLDFEYTTSLLYPHEITYYSEGRNDSLATNGAWNILLDTFDKSYCYSDGGNDVTNVLGIPLDDPKFNLSECGTVTPTHIFSISYGGDEVALPDRYMQRQCAEFGKMAMAGHTFFFSSGDNGVASAAGCINETLGTSFQNGTNYVQGPGLFVPSFTSTCPWVTSVGATQLPINASVYDREIAAGVNLGNETDPEFFYSGGGFSNVFERPQYQAEAVAYYLNNTDLPTSKFNTSFSRGYPDISANGVQFSLALGGQFTLVYGTSASTPVVASIFTLINGARLNAGKSPLGFINPSLYQNPDAMNDIVYGNNAGCGSDGFPAVKGWDAVTGLGTPNYPKLLKVFMNQ